MKKSPFSCSVICIIVLILASPAIMTGQKVKPIAYTSKINGSDVIICPVSKVKDTIELKLTEILESCEVIKLQNVPDALYDRAWHAEISDKYICIKSYGQQPAKLYDKKGQFIRNIGAIGRGPGEYPTLNGLQFSKKGDLIYLLPFGNTRKILVYDVAGNKQKDIPLAFTQRKFKAFFSDSVITVLSMPFPGDSAICFQQDFKGRVLRKVTPPSYLFNKSFDGEVFTNYLTPEYDLYNTASDTLYHYNTEKNKLEPKFAKDFGEKKQVTTSRELPGYFFFWTRGEDKKSRMVLVNKKNLDAKYFKLKNDFFGNIDASPVFSNGYFFNSVPAISLKKQIESALKSKSLKEPDRKKLEEFNSKLLPDDNNVIFYGKLKKVM
jgi:hypothetical protein